MIILYTSVLVIFSIPGHKCDFSVDVSSNYSDTCHYEYGQMQYPCGDICVNNSTICTCGDEVILPSVSLVREKYCCTPPSVQCMKTLLGATCPEGEVLESEHIYLVDIDKFDPTGTTPCNGQCYNDYVNSQFLGQISHILAQTNVFTGVQCVEE